MPSQQKNLQSVAALVFRRSALHLIRATQGLLTEESFAGEIQEVLVNVREAQIASYVAVQAPSTQLGGMFTTKNACAAHTMAFDRRPSCQCCSTAWETAFRILWALLSSMNHTVQHKLLSCSRPLEPCS